ncbi:MAG: hypothetical protein IKS98_13230 [Lachnospiraceae bacterium]|nr:hypothetical protein [Lachnospiraceae bacterium]
MSDANTSARTMCFETLMAEQTQEAALDAIRLCKQKGYSDENIENLLLLNSLTKGYNTEIDVSSVIATASDNCSYIQNKYCLNNACKVCRSNTEFSEAAEQRERNVLIHLVSTKKNSNFFNKTKVKTNIIKEKFVSYVSCAETKNGAPVYLHLSKDIYIILVDELTKPQVGKDEVVNNAVPPNVLYKKWCFLNSSYCDENGENAAVRTYINHIYTTSTKEAGNFKDLKEYFVPTKKKATDEAEGTTEEQAKPENETRPISILEADPSDFDDFYITPGVAPVISSDNGADNTETEAAPVSPNPETEENAATEGSEELKTQTDEPATNESVSIQDTPDGTEDFEFAEPEPYEGNGVEIDTEEGQQNGEATPETIPGTVTLETDIDIPEVSTEENEDSDAEKMIPTLSYELISGKGYVALDVQKLQSVMAEMNRYTASATIDIIHFKEYPGVHAVMTTPKSRYVFTTQQFSFMKQFFNQGRYAVMTNNLTALYAVLKASKLTVKVIFVQPDGKGREQYLRYLKNGDLSFEKVKSLKRADDVDIEILKAYAHSFRFGTGDEDCIRLKNGLPEIVTKQFTDNENESLMLLTLTNRNIPAQGWNVIKDDVIAALGFNEVLSKHKSRIHFVEDEKQTFTFIVPKDKVRSLQTVLVILLSRILEHLKCGSGIDFKVRKAFRVQAADQNTRQEK